MRAALLPVLLIVLLAACGDPEEAPEAAAMGGVEEVNPTLLELLASDPQFSVLNTAVRATGLDESLQDAETTLTLFAPTNSAFNELPAGTVDTLMTTGQRETLRNILLHHLIDGKNFATDAITAGQLTTLLGDVVPVTVESEGDVIRIDDATIQARDLEASNGIIHVIDRVMLPPAAAETPEGQL